MRPELRGRQDALNVFFGLVTLIAVSICYFDEIYELLGDPDRVIALGSIIFIVMAVMFMYAIDGDGQAEAKDPKSASSDEPPKGAS